MTTPDEIYASMTRSPSLTLPLSDALLFLNQCGNCWVSLKREINDGYVNVSILRVPKDRQGEGYGTAIMQALCAVADKRGWTLTVTPSRDYGATSVARLERFYGRLGFTHNRRARRDFDTQASMIRKPQR